MGFLFSCQIDIISTNYNILRWREYAIIGCNAFGNAKMKICDIMAKKVMKEEIINEVF